MDVIIEYVGWNPATVASGYVGVTTSATAAGMMCARVTAFLGADALPLSVHCAVSYAELSNDNANRTHQRSRQAFGCNNDEMPPAKNTDK